MKTILLKLSGPLQSWGTDSSFETRATDFHPSKSAIIGMIAASLGYKRDDDEKIQKLNELDFIVRIDQQGNLLRDYHIAQKYNNRGRFDRIYVTNRYYLEDAIFIVAISHEDYGYIEKIETGLKNPYFQTFMGKRSCPLTADFFIGTFDKDLITAITELDWQGPDKWSIRNEREIKVSLYADKGLIETGETRMRRDRVITFSQKHRQFGFRSESRKDIFVKNPHYIKEEIEEHDAFDNIGGV